MSPINIYLHLSSPGSPTGAGEARVLCSAKPHERRRNWTVDGGLLGGPEDNRFSLDHCISLDIDLFHVDERLNNPPRKSEMETTQD